MALGCSCGRKRRYEGPAAVERVLRVEVRVAGEDLPFAIAEELFGEKAFREEFGDIGFEDLAGVFFPAGDLGAADEGALRASEGDVRIGGFERERREQLSGSCVMGMSRACPRDRRDAKDRRVVVRRSDMRGVGIAERLRRSKGGLRADFG
jgi:hypothetical protein